MDTNFKIVSVDAENVDELGIYCIKNKKSPGYESKMNWFQKRYQEGLKLLIAHDEAEKQLGFIEYIPSEYAWRPVMAKNYLFIHCIALFVKDAKNKGIGSALIKACIQDAKRGHHSGVCAMSSDGPWIANKSLYLKNGFEIVDQLDRFELMSISFDTSSENPRFIDWRKNQEIYKGWNLIYSDQCPWHEKSVTDLKASAHQLGVKLQVKKINSSKEAMESPSGFGTFSLIKDGKLLADHYISKTRFQNIVKKELNT